MGSPHRLAYLRGTLGCTLPVGVGLHGASLAQVCFGGIQWSYGKSAGLSPTDLV